MNFWSKFLIRHYFPILVILWTTVGVGLLIEPLYTNNLNHLFPTKWNNITEIIPFAYLLYCVTIPYISVNYSHNLHKAIIKELLIYRNAINENDSSLNEQFNNLLEYWSYFTRDFQNYIINNETILKHVLNLEIKNHVLKVNNFWNFIRIFSGFFAYFSYYIAYLVSGLIPGKLYLYYLLIYVFFSILLIIHFRSCGFIPRRDISNPSNIKKKISPWEYFEQIEQ